MNRIEGCGAPPASLSTTVTVQEKVRGFRQVGILTGNIRCYDQCNHVGGLPYYSRTVYEVSNSLYTGDRYRRTSFLSVTGSSCMPPLPLKPALSVHTKTTTTLRKRITSSTQELVFQPEFT